MINRAYNQTCAYVQAEIAKILRHIGDKDSLAYEYRMKRLNALLVDVERQMKDLYGINLTDTTAFLKSIIPAAYYHTIFDVAQGIGQQPVFSRVNTRLIDTILKEPWSGTNYSKRIWSNTEKLAGDIRQVLTEATMSGESIYKTSRKLSEAFATTEYNSTRLIRTETTYACNRAEMTAYNGLDIDRYKFVATLDTRTSTICQKLDGKIFKTKDAQAGKNLPAMHPNCRSTTIPCFEDGMPEIRAARDKDGNRIKVPADMTYPEWYEKYIKPSEGGNGSQKPQNTLDSKPAEINIPAPDNGQPEYTDTPIPKNVNNSSVDKSAESDIIKQEEEQRKRAAEIRRIREEVIPLQKTDNVIPRQKVHRQGTKEYYDRQTYLKNKKKYGPGYVTISDDEIIELVNQYKGKGDIRLTKKGEWDNEEIIITNDKIVGVVVNDLTGKSVPTSVFKIHYSNDGIHIVPDYPSKKRGERK